MTSLTTLVATSALQSFDVESVERRPHVRRQPVAGRSTRVAAASVFFATLSLAFIFAGEAHARTHDSALASARIAAQPIADGDPARVRPCGSRNCM